jgi:hypothetical protein
MQANTDEVVVVVSIMGINVKSHVDGIVGDVVIEPSCKMFEGFRPLIQNRVVIL